MRCKNLAAVGIALLLTTGVALDARLVQPVQAAVTEDRGDFQVLEQEIHIKIGEERYLPLYIKPYKRVQYVRFDPFYVVLNQAKVYGLRPGATYVFILDEHDKEIGKVKVVIEDEMDAKNIFPHAKTTAYDEPKQFSDTNNHWGKEYIERLTSLGVVGGYADGTFKPDQLVTRGEFFKMFAELTGAGYKPYGILDHFADGYFTALDDTLYVNESTYAHIYGNNYEKQLIKYYDTPISRLEVARMVVRRGVPDALAYQLHEGSSGFADDYKLKPADKGVVYVANKYGFLGGYPDGEFKPGTPITRAQAAKILTEMVREREPIVLPYTRKSSDLYLRSSYDFWFYDNPVFWGKVGSYEKVRVDDTRKIDIVKKLIAAWAHPDIDKPYRELITYAADLDYIHIGIPRGIGSDLLSSGGYFDDDPNGASIAIKSVKDDAKEHDYEISLYTNDPYMQNLTIKALQIIAPDAATFFRNMFDKQSYPKSVVTKQFKGCSILYLHDENKSLMSINIKYTK